MYAHIDIWYVAMYIKRRQSLFKSYSWGQIPPPPGHMFYIRVMFVQIESWKTVHRYQALLCLLFYINIKLRNLTYIVRYEGNDPILTNLIL